MVSLSVLYFVPLSFIFFIKLRNVCSIPTPSEYFFSDIYYIFKHSSIVTLEKQAGLSFCHE